MTIQSTNDNIPTAPAITYSECYRLPFLSLFHADCMEIMKQYPDKYFDLAIVDPPYGIGMDGGNVGYKGFNNFEKKDWDKEIPSNEYFAELFRVSKNQVILAVTTLDYHRPAVIWFGIKGKDFTIELMQNANWLGLHLMPTLVR